MNYKLITCILVFVLATNLVFAMNVTFICSQAYDFIVENYESGNLTYSTEQINNLTDKINNLGNEISADTIINYVDNYVDICSEYKELPASYLSEILKSYGKSDELTFYQNYKYELIFISFILIGILGLSSLKNKK